MKKHARFPLVCAATRRRSGMALRLPLLLVLLAFSSRSVPASAPSEPDAIDWARERQFWSFRPPLPQAAPRVSNPRWPRRRIDHFILAGLDAHGLVPAFDASPRTLIRRATLDLTGLPPTPEEVDAFLRDTRADAFERLVNRLLASRRFGERMASLWLPLARYAEDQAHQVGADTKYFYPNAWRYREWVINAFNRDLPYDQFLALQLAADRLEGANSPNLAALGFLGLGPKYYNRDRLDVQADEWEDRVDTVTRAMLGLTVACARCHDHKFDPIPTEDYYALAGVFASTRMVNRRPQGDAEATEAQSTNLSPATLHVVEDSPTPQDLNVFLRGNVERKGPLVARHFLRVLASDNAPGFHQGSGRAELALAIVDPANPLTARVFVNRIWGLLFGKPLVATPSNFGHSGQLPTHPELLDDLARRFIEQGWSIQWLVRELVLSATYRQDSCARAPQSSDAGAPAGPTAHEPPGAGADPANAWFGRANRRRLSVEQWRDTVLFLSGELDPARSGRSLELDDPHNLRRTVYARISRLHLNDLLMQFDYPDANVHAEKRSSTTTAMQKLFVLNSPFMIQRAKALAGRLQREGGPGDSLRIQRAYQLLFAREPSPEEIGLALEFLRKPARGELSRWEQYAQLLLASNELLYVD